jgi:uncharacterized coiled-coil DUF342 family protein|tara:strand:- start:1762 stop:2319 length:558 start_codon:yes stop_codon:yes gene_type:complete
MNIKDALNVDEDLGRVNDLYKEMKIHRRKRNYQHKRMRGHKQKRDDFSQEVKLLVTETQDLKDERNGFNQMVTEFKQLRDDAVTGRDAALKSGDDNLAKKLDKKQEEYHTSMVEKATQSQEYQEKIEALNMVFTKKNTACSDAHTKMIEIRVRAERFHQDFLVALREIERIKTQYNIDFIEYGDE